MISDFIEQDLQRRLALDEDVPLNLRTLAKEYGTSVNPVNTAVKKLIDKNILRRKANGRLVVYQVPKNVATETDQQHPDSQLQIVQNQLINWSLQGEDRVLREEAMEQHFQIGRTALRRLFFQIALTGIISHSSRKGWRLRGFKEQDLTDYLNVRMNLELLAVDLAQDKLDRVILQDYLDKNRDSMTLPDESFHNYLIGCAENHYIQSFVDTHGPFFWAIFSWEDWDPAITKLALQQHRKVLRHLIARRWDEAKTALADHILDNRSFLLKNLRQLKAESLGK
ncbi:MAG: GntR family transcriptional regulator [Chloroflexota bacterium]